MNNSTVITAETVYDRVAELGLLIKLLNWASKEDNIMGALRSYCRQYGLDYDAAVVILKTSLKGHIDFEDDIRDTLMLVELELDSGLMLDRRQLSRKNQYIEAIHKVINCLEGDLLTFATLRYIELKSLKDLEQSMEITRADSLAYIKEISSQLLSVKHQLKFIYKKLYELSDIEKRVADEKDSIKMYEDGAKLTNWQLKKYQTAKNIIDESKELIARLQGKYTTDILSDINKSLEIVRETFKRNAIKEVSRITSDTPIQAIKMSTRLKNVLMCKPINNLGELSGYTKKQIKGFHLLGDKTYEELEVLMKNVGLEIKEN